MAHRPHNIPHPHRPRGRHGHERAHGGSDRRAVHARRDHVRPDGTAMDAGRHARGGTVLAIPVEHEPEKLARPRGIRFGALGQTRRDGPLHGFGSAPEPPDDRDRGIEHRRAGHAAQPQHPGDRLVGFRQDRHARHSEHPQRKHELRVHRPEGRAVRQDP